MIIYSTNNRTLKNQLRRRTTECNSKHYSAAFSLFSLLVIVSSEVIITADAFEGYQKKNGHRQCLTQILIEEIN